MPHKDKEARARYAKAYREQNRDHLRELNRRWAASCKPERNAYRRDYYRNNAEREFDYQLRRRYGITLADYRAIEARQDAKCAICHERPERPLCVDHDHRTGKVRGLLCYGCNLGLGNLADSPAFLIRAVEYCCVGDVS